MELEPAEDGWWVGEGTTIAMPAHWRATAIIAYGQEGREVDLDFAVGVDEEDDGHEDGADHGEAAGHDEEDDHG